MLRRIVLSLLVVILGLAAAAAVPMFWPTQLWSAPESPGGARKADAERGAYLINAGGCTACHTRRGGRPLAGGVELKTPFGTFVAPNITPDPETGIGKWTERDFLRAMRAGLSPSGSHYYPAFPYTSYTKLTVADLHDMWAYLKTVAPVRSKTADHRLDFPWSFRPGLGLWKLAWFDTGPFVPDPTKPDAWNRGAYLVKAALHCAECHTPRDFAGGLDTDRWMAGGTGGWEGGKAPNITPSPDGLAQWSRTDMIFFLKSGMLPSGDAAGGDMGKVIGHTSKLTDDDIDAVIDYLRSLPALPGKAGGSATRR